MQADEHGHPSPRLAARDVEHAVAHARDRRLAALRQANRTQTSGCGGGGGEDEQRREERKKKGAAQGQERT